MDLHRDHSLTNKDNLVSPVHSMAKIHLGWKHRMAPSTTTSHRTTHKTRVECSRHSTTAKETKGFDLRLCCFPLCLADDVFLSLALMFISKSSPLDLRYHVFRCRTAWPSLIDREQRRRKPFFTFRIDVQTCAIVAKKRYKYRLAGHVLHETTEVARRTASEATKDSNVDTFRFIGPVNSIRFVERCGH